MVAASWRVGLLVLVTSLVWAMHNGRLSLESWSYPTDYVGDAHEVLARIKAVMRRRLAELEGRHLESLPDRMLP